MASNVEPIEVVSAATNVTVLAGASTTLYGYSIAASAAGTMYLRRTSATGKIIAVLKFTTSQLVCQAWFGPQGVRCDGIYLARDGTVTGEGVVYAS